MFLKKKNIDLKKNISSSTVIFFLIFYIFFTSFQFIFLDDAFLLATKINMISIGNDIEKFDFNSEEAKIILSDYEANHNYYLEIYSAENDLVYTTESNTSKYNGNNGNNSYALNPRIMKILSRTENSDGSYFEIRREYYATAEYIVYGNFIDDSIGFDIYYSLDAIKDSAEIASWVFSSLTLGVFIVVLITINLTTKKFTTPLKVISKTTNDIAHLDFSNPCPTFKFKDLNELSANINTLSENLSSALERLETENKQLESDIELERRLEKARRSFIANISHELKTPISIIQGYAEGMKLGIGCDSTDEFCDIIIDESEKMNNLVIKLLEYMHYNSGSYKPKLETFDLSELIITLVEKRKLQLQEENINIVFNLPEEKLCNSDLLLIENIFNNYLSNAISHIDFDKTITVSVTEAENTVRLSVHNTGKPIPGTDIEHIWDTFYRADKAHSREQGRFGLGLSIVASNQELLKQKYGVINHSNGPTFWFDIAKA